MCWFKESLDDLEKMVVPLFSDIENKHLEKTVFSEHPWGPEQLKRKIRILPIADQRFLRLQFPMPDVAEHYKSDVTLL